MQASLLPPDVESRSLDLDEQQGEVFVLSSALPEQSPLPSNPPSALLLLALLMRCADSSYVYPRCGNCAVGPGTEKGELSTPLDDLRRKAAHLQQLARTRSPDSHETCSRQLIRRGRCMASHVSRSHHYGRHIHGLMSSPIITCRPCPSALKE